MENIPSEHTIRQAAVWYARLRAPDCGPAERHAFQEWLESDPSHRQAYQSAERAARLVSGQLAADSRLRALAQEALKPVSASSDRSQREQRQSGFQPRVFLRNQMRYAAALMLGMGIALVLDQRELADPRIGLAQPHAVPLPCSASESSRKRRSWPISRRRS